MKSFSRTFIIILLIFTGISLWVSQSRTMKQSFLLSGIDQTTIVDGYKSEYTLGEEIISLESHTGGVNDISFSPNASLLASCDKGKILIWDIRTGEFREILADKTTSTVFKSLTFSSDSTTLAIYDDYYDSLNRPHSHVRLINITTEEEIWNTSRVGESLAFSRDGLKLAIGSGDDKTGELTIYDGLDGNLIHELKHKPNDKGVTSVDFSPDGFLLVSSHYDNPVDSSDNESVKLWDVNEGEIIHGISDNSGTVSDVKFSPNGTLIAAGGMDRKVTLWDTSGEMIWSRQEHTSSITALDFSPTGSILATGDSLGNLKIWDITGKIIINLSGHHTSTVSSLAFSPDGSILASASWDNKIKLWNMIQRVEKVEISSPFGDLKAGTMSSDGLKIATGDSDGNIFFQNLVNEKFDSNSDSNGSIDSIVFSPNSSLLVSAGESESITIWNITQDQLNLRDTFSEDNGRVYSVTFSPDGSMLASSSDSMIRIWNVTNGEPIENLTNHSGEIRSVVFSPTGDLLASGSKYSTIGSIILWNTNNWQIEANFSWNDNYGTWPLSLAFSPDGLLLAAGGRENTDGKKIRIWDVSTGNVIEKGYSPLTNQTRMINCVDFSSDSKVLASGSSDGSIKFWDLSTGAPIYSFPEESSRSTIVSLTFSSNNYIFTSASDDMLTLWNLTSIPRDYDGDGMPDDWESKYGLKILDWGDKFDDPDTDGLINSLECFLKTNPTNNDTDDDKMPDGWEYLRQLDPTKNDADSDKDDDGMSNIYEYQWDLNPLFDDSSEDYDNDNLTNLQEFLNGRLNPRNNDTDSDRMPDLWEVQMGLNGSDSSDAKGDKDQDGMENLWEYDHGFNASNSADAYEDFDGDGVRNVDECKGGSDPKNFWDVPLLSLSAVHLLLGLSICIILGIGFITVKGFIIFREKQRTALVNQLGAPDYITAVKIQQLNLKNYAELQVEVDKAKDIITEGTLSRTRGQLPLAVQLYEQALKQYSPYMDDPLVAETVFNIAWAQRDLGILPQTESLMEYFPQPPDSDLTVKTFHNMLEAVLAEEERNWGLANKAWQAALDFKELKIEYQAICQGSLVNLEFRNWLSNPIPPDYENLVVQVNEWQEFCRNDNLYDSLCWAYLTHARITLAAMEFDEAEDWFNDCLKTAEEHQIIYYQEIVQRETEVFEKHKNKIYALTKEGEPLSPSIHTQLVQEYLLKAKDIVKQEDQREI